MGKNTLKERKSGYLVLKQTLFYQIRFENSKNMKPKITLKLHIIMFQLQVKE